MSLSLASGATREQYIAPDAVQLSARVNAGSRVVTAGADQVHGEGRPAAVPGRPRRSGEHARRERR